MRYRSGDRYGSAVSFLLLGVAASLGLDLCAKWLLADYPLPQFVFLRSMIGLFFFLIAARWYGGIGSLATRRWRWHLFRTCLAAAAMFGFFYGLSRMPLVNTLTIAFTAPAIVTALSAPFLGEKVGWRAWLAVVVGFVGVLVVLRPGAGMFTPAALAVIVSAFAYAGLALTARSLALTESSLSLAVYVVPGPALISAAMLPGNVVMPTLTGWFLFSLAGFLSAVAWVGIVGGYRRAPPATLAPFEYTALVAAAIAGYLIWDEVPDAWVLAGGLLIVASGLFIAFTQIRALRHGTASGAVAEE